MAHTKHGTTLDHLHCVIEVSSDTDNSVLSFAIRVDDPAQGRGSAHDFWGVLQTVAWRDYLLGASYCSDTAGIFGSH
jgi:hypothetical protein